MTPAGLDPLDPELCPLTDLLNRLPKRPSPTVVWRWTKKGTKGTRLETLKIAGRQYSTETELRRFIAATQDRKPEPVKTDHEAVERQLRKRGYAVPSDAEQC